MSEYERLLTAYHEWRRRKKKEEQKRLEERKAAALAAGEDFLELEPPKDVGEEGELVDVPAANKSVAEYEQMRALSLEVARRDPELAARVVRGWLADDARAASESESEQEQEAA